MNSMKMIGKHLIAPALVLGLATGGTAFAEEPAAPEAAPAPALPTLLPAMSGPLTANAKPNTYDAGPLGSVYITGVVSGFAQSQDNVVPGDRSSQVDVSNAQIFINKPTGLVQYFIQA